MNLIIQREDFYEKNTIWNHVNFFKYEYDIFK